MNAPDPPNKCYCKFEKQHFLILADVFKDMSEKCSDPSFANTLIRSSEVFANMATNCSESRAPATQASVNAESDAARAALEATTPQAPQNSAINGIEKAAKATSSVNPQINERLKKLSALMGSAIAANDRAIAAVNPSASEAKGPQAAASSSYDVDQARLFLSSLQNPHAAKAAAVDAKAAAPQAPQNSENLEAQFMRAIPVAKAESEARAAAKAEAEAREVARAEAEANALERRAKAAAKTNAAPQKQPQVPAIQDDTLIRFPNGSTSSYQTLMTALNNTRMQHRNNTDLYNYLTLILDQVKDAQSVSEVERVLTEHKQLSNALLTRGTNGYYFSIDAAGGTRKRRLKRTLRKRSKRTKKARKRK
jgi:hypothetical protein